jgi:hypothetical protein
MTREAEPVVLTTQESAEIVDQAILDGAVDPRQISVVRTDNAVEVHSLRGGLLGASLLDDIEDLLEK